MRPLLSICIPSYNRPQQLVELLSSVDCDPASIEIVVCEDHSPQRQNIRESVVLFSDRLPYKIRYVENEINLGFDGNIRKLVELATGHFVMFMGDDDLFIPGALDRFLKFLKEHEDKKYILRSYISIHPDGWVEDFRYLPTTTVLPHGEKTVVWLFKRSVTICGFTINRDDAQKVATKDLDGTLLYQVYLMAKICLEHDSIYCDFPVVQAGQSFRDDKPNFGSSVAEKSRYKPGSISEDNSINFTKAYFEVTKYLDRQHGTLLTDRVRVDLSKYSYPFLSIQRKRGVRSFLKYANRLEAECGLGCTLYYFVYKWGLVLLGERLCDRFIGIIKNVVGHTPNF
ncbi:MAG: glycosyltransferase [Candidatus Omnitrophica bacterium]|nr:glycosyltransferase [Patescibacteria group bacterium]MBU1811355.1 glycosyltransferase [Candidatus Omnitrophota bacterium]